jgi:glycosyltransferase involved in cell wall biosynthesis
VILYAYKRKSNQRVEHHEGIEYRYIPVEVDRWLRPLRIMDRWQLLPAQRPIFASLLYYPTYILQIAKDLQKQQCDIVHIHQFSQFVPIIRAFNPDIKIVMHMQCEWLTQLDPAMIARRLQQADLVIGCSDYIVDKIRKRFPQFADRCHIVYNGVDTNYFISKSGYQKPRAAEEILFVGRISPEKGIHVLLDAFQEVAQQFPQATLKIIGPESIASKEFIVNLCNESTVAELASFYKGSYLAQLKSRIRPELADRIIFTGGIPPSQLREYYWNADILVNPSLSEAFGNSIVEGMATETPVIGARVGGMTNIIEMDKTGLLVDPGNVSSLAEALRKLLSNPELRTSMGKAGRQRVLDHFSWNRVANSLLDRYRQLCEPQASLI